MLTTRKTKNRELFDLPDFRSEHSHSQFTSSLRVTQWLAADRQATKTVQVFIIYIYMTKLLQSDWLRGVQLMIFVMAGGAGNQNNKNPIAKFILYK